jgi:hypothetical protein
MQLHVLYYGKSKKKMKPIMIDSKKKCENYQKARSNVEGFHKIEVAPEGSKVWRKKSTTIGGNKDVVPKINRHGQTSVNGWIGKNGFNQHT